MEPTSGKAVYMYGVGGRSDVCFQQEVQSLVINNVVFENFTVQFGMIKEQLGFSAIIGSDFFSMAKLQIDFRENRIY